MNPLNSSQSIASAGSQHTPYASSAAEESGNDSPRIAAGASTPMDETAKPAEIQGLTSEGKALIQALQEIEKESELARESLSDGEENDQSDRSFSMKKALTAAATIGGILLAVG
jgi:hypothetical protein